MLSGIWTVNTNISNNSNKYSI